jgi:hypothetical protein
MERYSFRENSSRTAARDARSDDRKEMQFPISEVEITLHQRVLADDATASADLFALYVEPLISAVRHDLGGYFCALWKSADVAGCVLPD